MSEDKTETNNFKTEVEPDLNKNSEYTDTSKLEKSPPLSDNDENDDISIDFSAVKNKFKKFFKNGQPKENSLKEVHHTKKSAKAEEKTTKTSTDDNDEDISFDFSKIKNIFKKDKTKKTERAKDEEDLSLDLKKITAFTKKHSKWLIPLILIAIAIGFSTYYRAMPIALTIADSWAESTVNNYYRSQITAKIDQQYPNLPAQNKASLVEKEFQTFIKDNKEMIKQQTEQVSQQYQSNFKYTGEDGQEHVYLSDIDTYLWYGEANNYLKYGHPGTEIVDGKSMNMLRNGRYGLPSGAGIPFHIYFEIYLYKLVSFFNRDLPLMSVVLIVSILIINMSVIPAFFIGRKIGGNVGGFFAGMIVAINSALLSRTSGGVADTDPWNIFFPLMILWLFLEALETIELKKQVIYTSLSGLFVGLFSYAWGGWWYPFNFILGMVGIYFAYLIIMRFVKKDNAHAENNTKQMRQLGIVSGAFFLASALFVTLFQGFSTFLYFLRGPWDVIALKEVAAINFWPNVLTTVAEFNEIPLNTIASQMGSKLLFFLAIVGIILTLTKKDVFGKREVKYAIFLIIWFAGTAYGFTQGIRFAILMVPAFAVAFGACIGIIYQYSSKWITEGLKVDSRLAKTGLIAIFCLLLISPMNAAQATAKNEIILMNDAWYDSLVKLKTDSSPDAIMTSWWDFGHWFVALAERKVTFDGADQGERIHWVGKSLLTADEQVSIGLLRMLNCGQEKPPHVLEEFFAGDTVKAVDVLNRMMVLNDKQKAIQLLKQEGLTNEQTAEIIKVTYCDDLFEQYYITSDDMIGKSGVWGHFGSWDFERASMYNSVTKNKLSGKQILAERFNLTPEQADEYYYQITTTPADQWIGPWPGYQGNAACNQDVNKNQLECTLNLGQGTANLIIDLKTMNASIPSPNGNYYPNSLVYATKEGIEEKQYQENLIGMSVILLPESSQVLLAHPLQAKSIFTQLFFFNGHGLKCFQKFDDRTSFNNQRIVTWKVDFNCQQENKIYFLPKEEVHAAHILISAQERSEEEALALINSIAKNVTTANFAEYAKQYSEDPGSAVNGGDLGWFGKGVMVPGFEAAAFSLDSGEISTPIKTQFGYHLIYLIEERNQ
ncbi:MAG TPA: STT3 domain-containing protein [Candidatus Nanoarchaeia archaeon]|nr:STT3 domain-containing protein [Candidatus Nanoarchaeia archaeon]